MKTSNHEISQVLYANHGAVGKGGGGCKREQNVVFGKDNFKYKMYTYFIKSLSEKLLKNTKDGAASKMSNDIHLKLDDCQQNRVAVDISGLLATWPEFWAISLSFLGLYS